MWLRVLIALCVSTQARSQHTYASQKVQQGGTQFEWGWQLAPVVTQLPLNNLFVQPGPQIQYADNIGVFQNPTALANTELNYNAAVPYQIYQNPVNETSSHAIQGSSLPLDIFLLQQFPAPVIHTQENNLAGDQHTNIAHTSYNHNTYTTGYDIQTEHPTTNIQDRNDEKLNQVITPAYKENDGKANSEITQLIQVFKDHNCTNDRTGKENNKQSNIPKNVFENNDFGVEPRKNPFYKGATDFKIETRANTNNEGYYYYSTESPSRYFEDQEGISRLVASTQDLITNDDLIRINHSAEKYVSVSDDYIKPRSRYSLKPEQSRNNRNNQITVKAKIRNIENRAVEYPNYNKSEISQNNYENIFPSPIVVRDFNDDYKEQILDTLVSTMTPFIDNGYVITSITKNADKNNTNAFIPYNFNTETVYVTPRPVGQKYLAPITVALRLLNSNLTEFNSIDDHDTSDTEFVEKTVKSPSNARTIVEIQESIPLDITHINEVEVHEYLDEGRSHPFHNTYVQDQYKSNAENLNEVFTEYGKKNVERFKEDINDEVNNNHDRNEKLEPSENMETHVKVEYDNNNKQNNFNDSNTDENIYGKRNVNHRNIIQPIIVEKEVPVPRYIDRYTEKQVPYPEPKQVVKHVAVDRPIVVPVPYEKVVEKPIEVTKYIDKPYPVPIKIPYPVEQKVYVNRPVHVPYPVEKVVEKEIVRKVPVPTPVAVPVNVPVDNPLILPVPVEKPVHVEKIIEKEVRVPYPVEKRVLYPVPYEKTVHVPYPVETKVPVEKIIEKPVPVPIPVHVIKHYPIDRTVEKKVPFILPIDRLVEKKVPYPVEKVAEEPIATKYETKPYNIVEKVENKMPYIFQIPYTTGNSDVEWNESQNYNRNLENQPDSVKNKDYLNQLQKYLKDSQAQYSYSVPIQTTKWGNLYASMYKYINLKPRNEQKNQKYSKYLTSDQNSYYGPPPMQTYDNLWENNDYNSGIKLNRSERKPKVTNLRIEYGFKPPLIPSTEVDLDGRPINKEFES